MLGVWPFETSKKKQQQIAVPASCTATGHPFLRPELTANDRKEATSSEVWEKSRVEKVRDQQAWGVCGSPGTFPASGPASARRRQVTTMWQSQVSNWTVWTEQMQCFSVFFWAFGAFGAGCNFVRPDESSEGSELPIAGRWFGVRPNLCWTRSCKACNMKLIESDTLKSLNVCALCHKVPYILPDFPVPIHLLKACRSQNVGSEPDTHTHTLQTLPELKAILLKPAEIAKAIFQWQIGKKCDKLNGHSIEC